MDQRLRLITATTVMLVGLGLASLFRRPAGEKELVIPTNGEPLVLRKLPDRSSLAPGDVVSHSPIQMNPSQASPLPVAAREPQRPMPVVLTPSDRPAPPPEFPRAFPMNSQPATSRWGVSLGEMLPETPKTPATHKVSDGDSLALLADRYLGSAQRAMEIFEANRNVLANPGLLPIGVELRIPRTDQASAQPADSSRVRALVPLDPKH